MKFICLYEKISDTDYLIGSRYNAQYHSIDAFKGQDYILLEEEDFPSLTPEPGFLYYYHVNPTEPTNIWITEDARDLDDEEKTKLVLDNYDNIVELFNQVDTLNAEVNLLKEKLNSPPPLGIFDNSIN